MIHMKCQDLFSVKQLWAAVVIGALVLSSFIGVRLNVDCQYSFDIIPEANKDIARIRQIKTRKNIAMSLTATILCSVFFLIGLAVSSTVPPTKTHDSQPSSQHTTVHYSTNHSTVVDHSANKTSGNHSGTGNDTGHEDHEGGDHEKAHGIHLVTVDFEHVKYPLVFGLVVILAGLSKIGFHHSDFLSSKVPESCMLIILGIILGAIIFFSGVGENIEFFSPHEFFMFLLPPIILEAAFSLHDRVFLENIGSILLFSVVGTVLACFFIGLTLIGLYQAGAMEDIGCSPVQLLVFSSLIVAVDPVAVLAVFQEIGVNNVLYFMVFGESLLNDGVTVVLYNVMQTYNRMDTIEADQIVLGILKFFIVVFGGLLIGILLGLVSSFLTKFTNSVKVVEPLMIFGFAYEAYVLAEMFHFSGIISIIGCGLTQVQYAFANITSKSKLCVKFFAKVISSACEIIIFLFLGLKIVTPDHDWKTGFTLWTMFFCLLYRFLITFVMSFLINRCDTYRVRKIKLDEMFMISYGGLRGAVCFSLVALLDEKEFHMKNMFVTTTLFVILFTVFIQGGTIKWLVKWMRVTLADTSKDMILYQELNQHVSDHLMAGIEEVVGHSGKFYLREKIDRLDNIYMRPIFLRNPTRSGVDEISQYYEKLMMREHRKNLQLCGVSNHKLPHVPSGTDMHTSDSEVNFRKIVDDDEKEAYVKQEHLRDRRDRLRSQKTISMGVGENVDLYKLFRRVLVSTTNRNSGKFHDKNFVTDDRLRIAGRIRRKHNLNARLSTMQSTFRPPLEHTMSWNPEDTEVCVRRTSEAQIKLGDRKGGKAHTVDLSGSPVGSPTHEDKPPQFELELADVFEEDEKSETDEDPLIDKTSEDSDLKDKQVKFTDENKAQANGKRKRKVNKLGSDEHSGQLLRQDAMKDDQYPGDPVEIAMKEINNEKLTKQKSV